MSGATGILITWKRGHAYVGDPAREIFINMVGVKHASTARKLGEAVLNGQKNVLNTEAMTGIDTLDPLIALPEVGGAMDGFHVSGLTATLSGEMVTVTPELVDPLKLAQEATLRRVERASNATVSMWGSPGGDVPKESQSDTATPPEFSVDGKLQTLFTFDPDTGKQPDRDSPVWRCKMPWQGAYVQCNLHEPGLSASRVDVIKLHENMASGDVVEEIIATCYIGAHKRTGIAKFRDFGYMLAGEALICRVVSAGLKAGKLTTTLTGAAV